jgi:long-subunit acyl-CoA synthetase (AMP-forming)
MNEVASKKGLKGFELVKNILIEPASFLEKKILTNTMKIQRH